MSDITAIAELIARWNTDEGKPYKGRLIDMDAYEHAPDDIGCMCAQGQVLHFVGGWAPDRLDRENQALADAATSKLLNISRAHAVLLRTVNDRSEGAPSVVLTDPRKVLGDEWSKLLDFWCHLDGMTNKQWDAAWFSALVAAGDAALDAAWAATWDAATWDATWDAARAATWESARDAARSRRAGTAWATARAAAQEAGQAAEGASSEIQGAEVMRAKGAPFFFLPAFGFADPADIPPRPTDYGVMPNKEQKP